MDHLFFIIFSPLCLIWSFGLLVGQIEKSEDDTLGSGKGSDGRDISWTKQSTH